MTARENLYNLLKARKANIGEVRNHADGSQWMKISDDEWAPVKKTDGKHVIDKTRKGYNEKTKGHFDAHVGHIVEAENKKARRENPDKHKEQESDIKKQKEAGLKDKTLAPDEFKPGHVVRVRPGSGKVRMDAAIEGMVGKIRDVHGRLAEIVNSVGKVFEVPLNSLILAKAEEMLSAKDALAALLKAGQIGKVAITKRVKKTSRSGKVTMADQIYWMNPSDAAAEASNSKLIVELIDQRNAGDASGAKKTIETLKKNLGDKFQSFATQFGMPRSNDSTVRQKWVDHIDAVSGNKKSEGPKQSKFSLAAKYAAMIEHRSKDGKKATKKSIAEELGMSPNTLRRYLELDKII